MPEASPVKLTLAEKIRKGREYVQEVSGKDYSGNERTYKFTLRRPTEVEWFDIVVGTGSTARFLPFVIGWEGVTEGDIINGGDPHPLPFDEALRDEWLADRSDLLGALVSSVFAEFKAYNEKRKTLAKN